LRQRAVRLGQPHARGAVGGGADGGGDRRELREHEALQWRLPGNGGDVKSKPSRKAGTSRRKVLQSAVVAAAGVTAGRAAAAPDAADAAARARDGRLRQSIIHWCFKDYWDVEQAAKVARDVGCRSVELVDPQHWPM